MTWCNDEKTLCRSSWASSAIRANFVEMSPEHRVPVTFPSRGSLKPDTPSLCRVLVGRVPRLLRYNECLRLLDGHSASLRFLRSAVPVVLALFVVPDGLHPRQRAAGGGRGFRSRIAHLRIRQEPSRSLQFLHLPRVHAPLYDPGRALHARLASCRWSALPGGVNPAGRSRRFQTLSFRTCRSPSASVLDALGRMKSSHPVYEEFT